MEVVPVRTKINNYMDQYGISRKFVVYWMPLFAWAGIIMVLSIVSFSGFKDTGINSLDKIAHFGVYCVLAVLIVRAASNTSSMSPAKILLFTLISCGAYGILLELVQWGIPWRHADPYDVIFNITGTFVGMITGKRILWQK